MRKEKPIHIRLFMILKNPSASQADFQKATNLSRMQVVIILNHLKDEGGLERVGSRRSGQWVLNNKKSD